MSLEFSVLRALQSCRRHMCSCWQLMRKRRRQGLTNTKTETETSSNMMMMLITLWESWWLLVRRHFVPTTNCPTRIFWATNCPRWQNVPLSPHATNCPSDKMSHFLSGDKMSHLWSYWHFSGDKLSQGDKMSHFIPGDKMSQLMYWCTGKLLENCWDILSVVPLCQFEGQNLGQRLRI